MGTEIHRKRDTDNYVDTGIEKDGQRHIAKVNTVCVFLNEIFSLKDTILN